MPRFKTFAAALLLGGTLFAAATFAQSIGRWSTGAPMPSARTEVAVAEVGGKIYVVGGFRGERELEVYDPVADRWSRGASIPRSLHHTAAVGLKDKLYVVGGFVEGWTPTDEVHEYDPASDRWQRLAALPTPRGGLSCREMQLAASSRPLDNRLGDPERQCDKRSATPPVVRQRPRPDAEIVGGEVS